MRVCRYHGASPARSLAGTNASVPRGLHDRRAFLHTPCPCRRFCPNTNNILYPKGDAAQKKLKFACRISDYEEEVPESEYCVNRKIVNHSIAEQTTFVHNVRNDPTLPRTRDSVCPACGAKEAVYFSVSTPEGMLLKFQCVPCGNRWNDSV